MTFALGSVCPSTINACPTESMLTNEDLMLEKSKNLGFSLWGSIQISNLVPGRLPESALFRCGIGSGGTEQSEGKFTCNNLF